MQSIGFIDENTKNSHRTQIIDMVQLIFDALQSDQDLDFANTGLATLIQDQAMDLAKDGFVPPPLPIDVLLLQRKLSGIFLLATKLSARVDIMALLDKHLGENRKATAC
jgi:hypothetical protein